MTMKPARRCERLWAELAVGGPPFHLFRRGRDAMLRLHVMVQPAERRERLLADGAFFRLPLVDPVRV